MAEIPDRLRCLFSATLERRGDSYVFEVPREELDEGGLTSGETYRVAVVPPAGSQSATPSESGRQHGAPEDGERTPPVEEGEVREVEIETVGDQGDGIAKVDCGYVLIIPGARPGDHPTVEVETVRQNVAFAQVVESSTSNQEDENGTRNGLAFQPSSSDDSETE